MDCNAPLAAPPSTQRLDSRDLPGRDKFAALRDMSRELMGFDLQRHGRADPSRPFAFSSTVTSLGGQMLYGRTTHTPLRGLRTPALMRDGLDDVYLCRVDDGMLVRRPDGEFTVPPGGLVLSSKARAHESITPPGRSTTSTGILMPRAGLAQLVPQLEEAPFLLLPPGACGAPAASLALAYAELVAGSAAALPPADLQRATAHLRELIAGAIAPAWAAAQPPGRDAEIAPRLALIQRDIRARLDWPGLDLHHVARLHHLTPRKVQRLFAHQGTSFSDFLREARMEHARALLADPQHRHRRVLEIALDCGFDDISAFSRAFRRRWGMTPSDAR